MPTSDLGHDMTEVELGKLERQINKVFSSASKGMEKDAREYFEKFTKRDEDMKKRVEAGEVTAQAYKEWRLAQIGRGKRLEALRDKLAEQATDANEVAIDMVNNAMPNIYALNRNYAAYTIERSGANIDFNLWDASTVNRLLKDDPDLMPNYPKDRAVNRGIDLAYGKKTIQQTITSGILQGWPIDRMAKNLTDTITGMSKVSAVRAARTATTGAENAGRMDSLTAASDMGIKTEKEWMCTHDSRTRDSHAEVDGTHVPLNKKFANGVMYPGDPSGPAREVYNCRCTLVCWFPEIEEENNQRYSYKDWQAGKELVLTQVGEESTIGPSAIARYKNNALRLLFSKKNANMGGGEGILIPRSVGAMARRDVVMDLETGEDYYIVPGTYIESPSTFAGKGSKVPYRKAEEYAELFENDPEDWMHRKGFALLSTEEGDRPAEVHWSECEGIGRVDMFIKRWLDEG